MADVTILNGYNIKDTYARNTLNGKITDPSTKANGNVLTYDGTDWVADNIVCDVTSVNTKTGAVVLDGRDINVDDSLTTKKTIKATFDEVNGGLTHLGTICDGLDDNIRDCSNMLTTKTIADYDVGKIPFIYNRSSEGQVGSWGLSSYAASVNGLTGAVVLDGTNLKVDLTEASPITVKDMFASHSSQIDTLETTVGDSTSGLVKDVADLKTDKQDKITTATASLTVAGWDASAKTQTVSVTGVTASSTVWISPSDASFEKYTEANIRCSAQASGTLTFKCKTIPTVAITVNVGLAN